MDSSQIDEVATASPTLGLRDELLDTLTELGYEEPTPVQRETIPHLIEGRDLVGQAATGTGKTAAFALPLLQSLDIGKGRPTASALVLVPTRELAMQVSEAIFKYGRQLGVKVVPVYGGQPIFRQLQSLERGVHVVVGTPGRVLDHLGRRSLDVAGHPYCRPRRGRRDARHGFRRGHRDDPRLTADGAPDGAVLGDDAAAHRRHRQALPRRPGAHHCRGHGERRPPGADHPAGVHRSTSPQGGGARADPRHRDAGGGARVLPHAHRGRHAHRDDERPWLPCRSAARRHGPGPARPRDGPTARRAPPSCSSPRTSPPAVSTSTR